MKIATEQANITTQNLDIYSIAKIIRLMQRENLRAVKAINTAQKSIAKLIANVVAALANGGRLFYVGAGTSGRLGVLDASECPPTFSVSPKLVQGIIAGGAKALQRSVEGAEDDKVSGQKIIKKLRVNSQDVVLGITASGLAAYVQGALQAAKKSGAQVWLLTCNKPQKTLKLDGIILVNTGAEILTGSTRLKAGTATKLVLNMITTIAMTKLGKVYDNLMVDVNPSNNKLRKRAQRIIAAITGCSLTQAAKILACAGNNCKAAIVMQLTKLGRKESELLLAKHKGFLREILRGVNNGKKSFYSETA